MYSISTSRLHTMLSFSRHLKRRKWLTSKMANEFLATFPTFNFGAGRLPDSYLQLCLFHLLSKMKTNSHWPERNYYKNRQHLEQKLNPKFQFSKLVIQDKFKAQIYKVLLYLPKGQIILKVNYGILNSSKKTNEQIRLYYYDT